MENVIWNISSSYGILSYMTFKYPVEQLEIVAIRMLTVEKIVELIKLKQFQEHIRP